jgi:hypothetical protein
MPPLRNLSFASDNIKQEIMPSDPIKNLVIAVLIVFSFVAVLLFGLIYYFERSNESLILNAKEIEKRLSVQPLSPMLDLYYDIKSINEILGNHDSVRFYLELISDSVADEVYYSSFNYSRKDAKTARISLNAIGRDFSSVVLQVDSLKREKYKDIITKVEIKGMAKDEDKIRFGLELDVRADIDFINTQFVDKRVTQTDTNTNNQ